MEIEGFNEGLEISLIRGHIPFHMHSSQLPHVYSSREYI